MCAPNLLQAQTKVDSPSSHACAKTNVRRVGQQQGFNIPRQGLSSVAANCIPSPMRVNVGQAGLSLTYSPFSNSSSPPSSSLSSSFSASPLSGSSSSSAPITSTPSSISGSFSSSSSSSRNSLSTRPSSSRSKNSCPRRSRPGLPLHSTSLSASCLSCPSLSCSAYSSVTKPTRVAKLASGQTHESRSQCAHGKTAHAPVARAHANEQRVSGSKCDKTVSVANSRLAMTTQTEAVTSNRYMSGGGVGTSSESISSAGFCEAVACVRRPDGGEDCLGGGMKASESETETSSEPVSETSLSLVSLMVNRHVATGMHRAFLDTGGRGGASNGDANRIHFAGQQGQAPASICREWIRQIITNAPGPATAVYHLLLAKVSAIPFMQSESFCPFST
ncbi:unnamed protein product [Protopolystoma xenopodis]|uniref:Uncharacterized protein n=1 Tax=Protopolystoma xenopodis TaxID=117903 RepID=A0A448XJX4_9PLAT|nr:unnamed protein product [Protopolystoma xenopodis]